MQTALSLSNILFFHSSLGHVPTFALFFLFFLWYIIVHMAVRTACIQITDTFFENMHDSAAFPSVLQALWGGSLKVL